MPPPTLPIVDISPFLPTSSSNLSEKQTCADAIFSACSNSGFFYLTNHAIPPSQTAEVLSLARTFFKSATPAAKASIARENPHFGDGDGARGWQRIGENLTSGKRDWHEAVDLYRDVGAQEGAGPFECLMGPNKWPGGPSRLREVYEEYVEKMLELGTAVVRGMGYALDPDCADVFVGQTRESFWVMRMIGYPQLPTLKNGEDEDGISCGAHTDYGCVTLLLADETKGALQVQGKDGDWIDADPVEDAFVVNIGDMMERWTNGLWKSTMHRVVHKGGGFRVSVPFFFEPDFDARVEPLERCVKLTGGERMYDGVVYGDHLRAKVLGNFYDDGKA